MCVIIFSLCSIVNNKTIMMIITAVARFLTMLIYYCSVWVSELNTHWCLLFFDSVQYIKCYFFQGFGFTLLYPVPDPIVTDNVCSLYLFIYYTRFLLIILRVCWKKYVINVFWNKQNYQAYFVVRIYVITYKWLT